MLERLPFGGHRLYDWLVGRPLATFYARLAKNLPEGWVLDIGCGPGHLAAALQADGRHVVALDLDPVQVRIAKKNHPELDVRQGDAAELPCKDDSFDGVVTSESYHHWSDRPAGIQEAYRVLRPGGTLTIIEGCGDVTRDEVRGFLGRAPWGMTLISRFVFRTHGFTPAALETELVALLEKSSFRNCRVGRVDGWWIVTASKRPPVTP